MHHELVELRRRMDHLANEVAAARQTLAELEARCGTAAAPEDPVVQPLPVSAAELPPTLPPALPPVLPPPVAPQQGEPFVPSPPSPWRPWLERLQLWPPQGGGDAEVRLGAWWATRLGTLFAVIGVVFFGVYLSLDTPPWIKLAEVVAVAVGMAALGWSLQSRLPRFGPVVFAGGQAVLFFAAFAAFTVPAVKVIESPAVAVVWQIAAAAAIGGLAWYRRSPLEATMSVVFGFVAAGFSLAGGLQLFALAAALALVITAVVWRRWLGWVAPSVVALVGFWSLYLALMAGFALANTPLLPEWVWVFWGAGFWVILWRDDPWGGGMNIPSRETRWVQNTNSSAALLCGWLTAWIGFPDALAEFYAAAAALLGLAAARRLTLSRHDVVGAVALAKASGALTLAVITWSDGRTTELALLVQAGVMLATNRRLRSVVLGGASGVVWLVSAGYAIQSFTTGRMPVETMPALAAVAYAVGATIWLLEAVRACRAGRRELARELAKLAGLAGGALAVATAAVLLPPELLPHRLMVAVAVLVALARLWRNHAVLAAAAVAAALAHGTLWYFLVGQDAAYRLIAAMVVLVPSLVAAGLLGRRVDRQASERVVSTAVWCLSALAVLTATLLGWESWDYRLVGSALLVLAGLLALAAPRWRRRGWLWLATWTVLIGTLTFFVHFGASATMGPLLVAALAVWAGVAAVQAWPRGARQSRRESPGGGSTRVLVLVGSALALAAAFHTSSPQSLLVLGGVGLAASALLTWVWVGPLRYAAWFFWGVLAVALRDGAAEVGTVVLSVTTAWLPVLIWGGVRALCPHGASEGRRSAGRVLQVQAWVAAAVGLSAILHTQTASPAVAWLTGSTVALVLLARWRWPELRAVAGVYGLFAWWWAVGLVWSGGTDHWSRAAFVTLLTALLVAGLPLVLSVQKTFRRFVTWGAAGAGLALAFFWAASQQGRLEPLVTVLWGGAALGCFALGVVARSRPHRLLGLLGILCCVPRVFLVDLQSTLHRIAAFAVLGAVLLWVGFSYHRFRGWITDGRADASKD